MIQVRSLPAYAKKITYYDEDGLTYWTMGAPVEETVIINRCKREGTYEVRLREVRLPAGCREEAGT